MSEVLVWIDELSSIERGYLEALGQKFYGDRLEVVWHKQVHSDGSLQLLCDIESYSPVLASPPEVLKLAAEAEASLKPNRKSKRADKARERHARR